MWSEYQVSKLVAVLHEVVSGGCILWCLAWSSIRSMAQLVRHWLVWNSVQCSVSPSPAGGELQGDATLCHIGSLLGTLKAEIWVPPLWCPVLLVK